MSANDFLSGKCHRCGGHLEFPAESAGSIADCPLCGQPTGLVPDKTNGKGNTSFKILIGIWLAVFTGLAVLFYLKRPAHAVVNSQPALTTNSPMAEAPAVTPAVSQAEPPKSRLKDMETNDFAISSPALEKTPGSSLVYVTGKVRNLDGLPRYGVKLEFGLSDGKGQPVGQATDYYQMLEPYGEWHFRALVLESRAVSVHFQSIHEAR